MLQHVHEEPRHLDDDVLEKGVPFDGVVDLGLVLVRQVDRLRVAAALEVEDAVVVPPCHRKPKTKTQKNEQSMKETTSADDASIQYHSDGFVKRLSSLC